MAHPVWPRVARVVGAPWHSGEVLDFAQAVIGPCVQLEAGIDEGLLSFSLSNSRLYGKFIYKNKGQE